MSDKYTKETIDNCADYLLSRYYKALKQDSGTIEASYFNIIADLGDCNKKTREMCDIAIECPLLTDDGPTFSLKKLQDSLNFKSDTHIFNLNKCSSFFEDDRFTETKIDFRNSVPVINSNKTGFNKCSSYIFKKYKDLLKKNDGNIITFDNRKLAKEPMEACPFLLALKQTITATGIQSFSNHLNKKDPKREFFVNCDYKSGDKEWLYVQ